jgi:hypothetical protein
MQLWVCMVQRSSEGLLGHDVVEVIARDLPAVGGGPL